MNTPLRAMPRPTNVVLPTSHGPWPEDGDGRQAMKDRSRVLECDNESQGVRALKVVLRGAGFDVYATHTAEEALEYAALRTPDAAIIEMLLPDGNGVDLCRELRAWVSPALIVLSAVGDEEQKVRALEAGADDYVLKPFGPAELIARLRAILRRAKRGSDEPVLECGGVHIDLAARAVRSGGEEIRLTPIEFRLLRALLANRGRLITHDALLRQAWGAAYVEDRQTLRAHVANLRRKLGSTDAHSLIHTYHGAGYLFEGLDGERSTARARPVPLAKPHVVVATHDPEQPRGERDEIPARRLIADATYRPAA
jgi:two-component system KDP operon response regulator KdpE